MPRGAPDYSNVSVGENLYRLDDMAELAARLGSPNTFDRSGYVVVIETFQYGIGSWNVVLSGTGAATETSVVESKTGGYSALLTGGSDSNRLAKIFRKFPYPDLNKYGLEASVLPGSNVYHIRLALAYYDGTQEHQFAIQHDPTTGVLEYYNADGGWTEFATDVNITYQYRWFQTVKMVVDLETDEYVRVRINRQVWDLAGCKPHVFTETDGPNVRVDLLVSSIEGYNATCYFDDIILTQNEP